LGCRAKKGGDVGRLGRRGGRNFTVVSIERKKGKKRGVTPFGKEYFTITNRKKGVKRSMPCSPTERKRGGRGGGQEATVPRLGSEIIPADRGE